MIGKEEVATRQDWRVRATIGSGHEKTGPSSRRLSGDTETNAERSRSREGTSSSRCPVRSAATGPGQPRGGPPGFVVDLARRCVEVEGREISLTVTEWKLLSFLVRNQGKVVSSQILADRVWGAEELSDGAIRVCDRRLRRKLGDDPQKRRILRSHRGMGDSLAMPR